MLTVGMQLGPYRIEDERGHGGMGEVYRARDTRLKRDVAIKVLPTTFAGDPDRRARFQREANLIVSPAAQLHGNFSPDGRLVAYTSNESGRCEIYVETVPRSDLKKLVSTTHGCAQLDSVTEEMMDR